MYDNFDVVTDDEDFYSQAEYQILGYKLYRTCNACPQQYDVLD